MCNNGVETISVWFDDSVMSIRGLWKEIPSNTYQFYHESILNWGR